MLKILLFISSVLLFGKINAQLLPYMGSLNKLKLQSQLYDIENNFHTAFGTVYFCDISELLNDEDDYISNRRQRVEWENSKGNQFFFQAMPTINLSAGYQDIDNSFIYNYGGGILFNGGIDDKLGINAFISYNYLKPFDYRIIDDNDVSVLHSHGFLNGAERYSNAYNEFSLTYRPYDFLLVEAGFGNHFIGDGYRSLLLSQNSYNYPYIKGETSFFNFKYNIVWAQLNNIHNAHSSVWSGLQTKYAVFHYLDWKISPHFSIGLFESVIMNQETGFDINYTNPVVLFRPIAFYLGSDDNAVMGINAKISITGRHILYGQVVIDDLVVGLLLNDIRRTLGVDFEGEYGWFANKWGLQGGYKTFDLFGIEGLNAFAELNAVRPYTYSHVFFEQNYSHFGQGLAHPLGANFIEGILGFDYVKDNFSVGLKFMYAQIGMDTASSHYGQNIFNPTMDGNQGWDYIVESYGNTILQGDKTTRTCLWVHGEYVLSKKHLLSINSGIIYRNTTSEHGKAYNSFYYYLGLRTSLFRNEKLF